MSAFQAKDGLHVERQENGAVAIWFALGDRRVSGTTLDVETWASLVAAVSARGDTAKVHMSAKALHMEAQKKP